MSISKFIKGLKTVPNFAKGIFGLHKKSYRLSFVFIPEDNLWYIDMPWPGDRYNLAMVAGSNKLLDYLCAMEDNNYVTVDVLPRDKREKHEGFFECEQTASSLLGGSFYDVHGLQSFARDIWICPVTLCVLGHYPKFIYIKKVSKISGHDDNEYAHHERQLLDTKLADLKMSAKFYDAIRPAGAITLRDLVNIDHSKVNWGKATMTEADDLLESLNLNFTKSRWENKHMTEVKQINDACAEMQSWLELTEKWEEAEKDYAEHPDAYEDITLYDKEGKAYVMVKGEKFYMPENVLDDVLDFSGKYTVDSEEFDSEGFLVLPGKRLFIRKR